MDAIDRNIKQRYLPFVLDPGKEINKSVDGVGGTPQIWSFRNRDIKDLKDKCGKLNIIPRDNGLFDKDISIRLSLSKFLKENSIATDGKNNLQHILDYIPAIQIREYTQDSRLDLVLSVVDWIKEGYKDGSEISKKIESVGDMKNYAHLICYDLKNISKSKYWKSIVESGKDILTASIGKSQYKDEKMESLMLLNLTYMLYYRLLSTTSTNIYCLPYTSNHIFKGNGYSGFDTDFGLESKGVLGKLLGGIGEFLAPNINITTTPIWKGGKGGEGINLDITFQLFNDTHEHALFNYLFINTIMGQNLPVQYGVLQGPPSLYDLRIEGGNRLFMCAGNFECSYKGVFRAPSYTFCNQLWNYMNKNVLISNPEKLYKDQNNIKIPDIYELTLHFKSLLPNSFNNFIYQFAYNSQDMKDIKDSVQNGMFQETTKVNDEIKNWLRKRADDAKTLKTALENVEKRKEEYDNFDESKGSNDVGFTYAAAKKAAYTDVEKEVYQKNKK